MVRIADVLADVSVIIPCFNSETTVLRAIKSVVNQTCLPAELIVIDDASSDGTVKVVNDFVRSYDGLMAVVLRTCPKNSGPSIARNIGWDMARHSYVAFLDSDDEWRSDKIEIQYKWMTSNLQCSFSGHKCVYPDSSRPDNDDMCFKRIDSWRILVSNPFPTPSVMIKRELPFRFDARLNRLEDQLLWAEIALSGYGCYFSPSQMTYVHKKAYGAGGLSASLIKMEIGELMMYKILHEKKHITFSQFFFFEIFSIMKFARRLFKYWFDKFLFKK